MTDPSVRIRPSERLRELGLELPPPPAPRFAYVPVTIHAGVAYVSGQVPRVDGELIAKGRVGEDLTVEEAREGARAALLNSLAQLDAAVGGIDNVIRVLRLTGYVASADGFTDQPQVIDGASRLAGEIFGEHGNHARTARGVAALPGNSAVELDVIAVVSA
jgi:enamine deaminase RidA (YjgF/YER057c/UK114 family)